MGVYQNYSLLDSKNIPIHILMGEYDEVVTIDQIPVIKRMIQTATIDTVK